MQFGGESGMGQNESNSMNLYEPNQNQLEGENDNIESTTGLVVFGPETLQPKPQQNE